LCSSGSPPAITTTGASHSSIAARQSAARASEIAAEQGFEHQDERKALASRQALANHIGADLSHLQNRYSQCTCSLKLMPFAGQAAQGSLVEFGRQLEFYIFCDSRQSCQFNRAKGTGQSGEEMRDKPVKR
jgi:hypothetical protein